MEFGKIEKITIIIKIWELEVKKNKNNENRQDTKI